jgi:hypothetical protein
VLKRVEEEEEGIPLANIKRLVASYDMGKLTGDSQLCSTVFRSQLKDQSYFREISITFT